MVITWLWLGLFGGLVCQLLRRHGWEHVPFLVLLAAAHGWATGLGVGNGADAVALGAVAGVWLSAKGTTCCDQDQEWSGPAM